MTVILNEPAILALFERPSVVAFMQRTAEEKIVPQMRADIRSYFVDAETGVEDDIGIRMDGSTAIVGLQDDPLGRSTRAESKSRRYARVGEWEKTRGAASGG